MTRWGFPLFDLSRLEVAFNGFFQEYLLIAFQSKSNVFRSTGVDDLDMQIL